MKSTYIDEVKNAIKSKEYWFGFSIIVISCVLTAIYTLAPSGIFGSYNIGKSEFFIAATMHGNTLLQISAPVISVFVCMNRHSLFMCNKEAIRGIWKSKKMKAHILTTITISSSVFLFSFLFIFLISCIIFPKSTGSIQPEYGLFKNLYQSNPFGYILAYILHSSICGALYALFGFSLKALIIEPLNVALFIPLIFYSCFGRLAWIFPFLGSDISIVAPLFTFDIAIFDVPPIKRVVELSFILAISILLIIISYYRNSRESKVDNKIDEAPIQPSD